MEQESSKCPEMYSLLVEEWGFNYSPLYNPLKHREGDVYLLGEKASGFFIEVTAYPKGQFLNVVINNRLFDGGRHVSWQGLTIDGVVEEVKQHLTEHKDLVKRVEASTHVHG